MMTNMPGTGCGISRQNNQSLRSEVQSRSRHEEAQTFPRFRTKKPSPSPFSAATIFSPFRDYFTSPNQTTEHASIMAKAHLNRRRFISTTSGVAGGAFFAPNILRSQGGESPNNKLRVACISVGGKGESDSEAAAEARTPTATTSWPSWTWTRRRLDKAQEEIHRRRSLQGLPQDVREMANKIDCVTVSTPDHTHFLAAMWRAEAQEARHGAEADVQLHLGSPRTCTRPPRPPASSRRWATRAAPWKASAWRRNGSSRARSARSRKSASGPTARSGRRDRSKSKLVDAPGGPRLGRAGSACEPLEPYFESRPLARGRQKNKRGNERASLQLARLVAVRLRRAGRHGLPHHGRHLQHPRPGASR